MSEDSHRVACESCAPKILPATAEIYAGYYAPCYKRFNATPPVYPKAQPRSFLGGIFDFIVPIGFIALFLIGFPLGYKLVLGGRKSTVEKGDIHSITLINPVEGHVLEGRPARIVSDYIVVELESGRYLWIPEENVAGIEFQND